MKVDIEVCHIYLKDFLQSPTPELSQEEIRSVKFALDVEKLYHSKGYEVTFSMMVDDSDVISSPTNISQIKTLVEENGIKLNHIIYESKLNQFGNAFINSINKSFITKNEGNTFLNISTFDRFLWAEENLATQKSVKKIFLESIENSEENTFDTQQATTSHSSRFWIPLKLNKQNTAYYTCPTLTAIWYLHRLKINEFTLYESDNEKPDFIISILPKQYLKSEAIAIELLRLSKIKRVSKSRKRIEYIMI